MVNHSRKSSSFTCLSSKPEKLNLKGQAILSSIIVAMRRFIWLFLLLAGLFLGACGITTPAIPSPSMTWLSLTPISQVASTPTWASKPSHTPTDTPQPIVTTTPVAPKPTSLATNRPRPTSSQESPTQPFEKKDCSRTAIGLTPLSDMGSSQSYQGEVGGLYGDGENTPPSSHLQVAKSASDLILPRDSNGEPSPDGKIGFVAMGMSNTLMEFNRFIDIAGMEKSDYVFLVNSAIFGRVASTWAEPDSDSDPWESLAGAVDRAGLSPEQVQVFWLKNTNAGPRHGRDDFPVFAEKLRDDLSVIVKRIKTLYPNVRVIYLSSRIYAGYSLTPLSPEPFAYEDGFAVKWLIEDQIAGGGLTGVNYRNTPVLLWGPYLWADGTNPRSDGLTWVCDDFMEDGVHPGNSGRQKVAEMLLEFLLTDPLARTWFTGSVD